MMVCATKSYKLSFVSQMEHEIGVLDSLRRAELSKRVTLYNRLYFLVGDRSPSMIALPTQTISRKIAAEWDALSWTCTTPTSGY